MPMSNGWPGDQRAVLTTTQAKLLSLLAASPTPSQRVLSKTLCISRARVQQIETVLKQKGWVTPSRVVLAQPKGAGCKPR